MRLPFGYRYCVSLAAAHAVQVALRMAGQPGQLALYGYAQPRRDPYAGMDGAHEATRMQARPVQMAVRQLISQVSRRRRTRGLYLIWLGGGMHAAYIMHVRGPPPRPHRGSLHVFQLCIHY